MEHLELELELERPAAAGPLKILDIRSLRPDEVIRLERKEPVHLGLAELSHRHRAVARLVARGLAAVDIADRTGYSTQTIYSLRQSPAFQDLVAHYEKAEDSGALDLRERLSHAAADGLEKLHTLLVDRQDLSPLFIHRATMDLLSASGQAAAKKLDIRGALLISSSELEAIKARSRVEEPAAVRPREFHSGPRLVEAEE